MNINFLIKEMKKLNLTMHKLRYTEELLQTKSIERMKEQEETVRI